MATSTPALYKTAPTAAGWQKVWSAPDPPTVTATDFDADQGLWNEVRFSPDETHVLVSRCKQVGDPCVATLLGVATGEVVPVLAELRGPNPSFSPDGSWTSPVQPSGTCRLATLDRWIPRPLPRPQSRPRCSPLKATSSPARPTAA